jgi:hypothetical protein
MNTEDEEFNRIEREANQRMEAVRSALNEHLEYLRKHMTEYERGVIDGRQMQVKSSVDKAVNAMHKREWVGLTEDEIDDLYQGAGKNDLKRAREIEAKLKEKNT